MADLDDPKAAQKRRLKALLKAAKGTQFGEEHGLDDVTSLEAFRQAVPIRTHQEMLPWLDRVAAGEKRILVNSRTRMLLETSGTTGTPKLLPVTRSWEESVQEAQRLWTLALVRDHPELATGKIFTVVSPEQHARSDGGLPIGSNTGRIRAAQPFWLRSRYVVPQAVVEIADPVVRQYVMLRCALECDVRTITTANPSMVLLLMRRLKQWKEELSADLRNGAIENAPGEGVPEHLRKRIESTLSSVAVPEAWTADRLWNLSSINCWTGGPAKYFADRLREMFPSIPVREVGISASEGSFAFPLANNWPGSVLWLAGHLQEFIGDDGQPRWAWELEVGEKVRLVVSTTAGLWRYDMADEVEVVGRCGNTPVVRFVGKAGRYLNVLGERVTEGQVVEAMCALDLNLSGFTVGIERGETPRYVLAFEGESVSPDMAVDFDKSLSMVNVEYAGKRKSGRLGSPSLLRLPKGAYGRLHEHRVLDGAPGGQVKDPVIAVGADEWNRVLQVSGKE
ncbi:MAG: GH3 auxin-responsive promoter family protein [Myxococcota bacterium]